MWIFWAFFSFALLVCLLEEDGGEGGFDWLIWWWSGVEWSGRKEVLGGLIALYEGVCLG